MINFILGLGGFLIAKYIRDHKTKNTRLVCMRGFDCHAVVHSDYSKFLGMPNELLGMLYYFFISVSGIFLFFIPHISPVFALILRVVSLSALLFSLYLIGVQIFIIKKVCSWCLISALISTLIFLLIFFN